MSDACIAPDNYSVPEVDKKYIIWPNGEPERDYPEILNHKGEFRLNSQVYSKSGSLSIFPIRTRPRLRDFAGNLIPCPNALLCEDISTIITPEQDKMDQKPKTPIQITNDTLFDDNLGYGTTGGTKKWVPDDVGCQSCKGEGTTLIVSELGKHITCTVCLGLLIPPIPPTEIYECDYNVNAY